MYTQNDVEAIINALVGRNIFGGAGIRVAVNAILAKSVDKNGSWVDPNISETTIKNLRLVFEKTSDVGIRNSVGALLQLIDGNK